MNANEDEWERVLGIALPTPEDEPLAWLADRTWDGTRRKEAGNLNGHEWLSPEEAAAYLGLNAGFIKAAFRDGRLPGARLGHRTLRFRRDDLDAFMEAQVVGRPGRL